MIKNKVYQVICNKEAKNAGWLIASQIFRMILSFFVSIFSARYLGPGNYGLIGYADAYVAFFTSLCTLGIDSVIVKDFIDNPNEQGETLGSTLFLRVISSILSTISIVCIISMLDKGETLTIQVAALCSVSLVFKTIDTFQFWFQARYESKVIAIVTFLSYIVVSIYKIVLLVLNMGVRWFAFATSVDYIFIAIFIIYAYCKHNGPKLKVSLKKARSLLGKSYHYILSGLMVAIYGQTDRLMLKQLLDETSVGYYSLAITISNIWVFVLTAIITSFYPTIMNYYKNKDYKAFEKKNIQLYSIIIYCSFFVGAMFLLFGRIAVLVVYGAEYEAAVRPLQIVTWYTAFSYLGVARDAWIVCTNNQKYLKYIYFCAAVLNVGMNFILIPPLGASGAALASLITQILTSMIIPCFIKDMRPNVKMMAKAFILKWK